MVGRCGPLILAGPLPPSLFAQVSSFYWWFFGPSCRSLCVPAVLAGHWVRVFSVSLSSGQAWPCRPAHVCSVLLGSLSPVGWLVWVIRPFRPSFLMALCLILVVSPHNFVAALFGIQSLVGIKFPSRGARAAVMQILRLLVETLGIFHVRVCVCAFTRVIQICLVK